MSSKVKDIFQSELGYLAIADRITKAVMAGQIESGDQLPTQRDLARKLGVSVATVTRGYYEAQRCGLISGKPGKGTYVTSIRTPTPVLSSDENCLDAIDLSISRPPVEGAAPFLSRALTVLSMRPQAQELLGTESANGSLYHRVMASKWMSRRGSEIAPNQIITCSGVQHALHVIFTALSRPGDVVATEALNFPGIKLLADIHSIKLVGVPIDEHGLQVDILEKVCINNNVRFVLCSPTTHNPTTATMSLERRHNLIKQAEIHDFLIIENDILGLMPEVKLPSLFSLHRRKTIYVTGTSKTIATGLRLGFISAATSLLHPLMGSVRGTIWMPSPLALGLFSQWVEYGEDKRILQWHREEIEARLTIVDNVLGLSRVAYDNSCYHVWVGLPPLSNSSDFTDQAFEHGIIISPSETFSLAPDQDAPHAIRISLGFPNDRLRLRQGLQRMTRLLEMYV